MRPIALLLAGLLSAAAVLAPARAFADFEKAGDAAAIQKQEALAPLRLSKHARTRMVERGVSDGDVRLAIEKGEAFRYFHQGRWKTGYYDSDKRLFIATADGLVITVIANATRRYVEGLKRKSRQAAAP